MTNSSKLDEARMIVAPAREAAREADRAGIVAVDRPLGISERQRWCRLSDGRKGLLVRHPPGYGPIATISLVVDSSTNESVVEAAADVYDRLGPYLAEFPEEGDKEYESI